jgi:eukaryotic-like serine/threonine-protein kinase
LSVREGASIGPYRVLRKIGEGGMGAVFLGVHTLLGRHAAIKVLLPELSSKREAVDRFFNEARATTVISDPGIVQVFDFGFTFDGTAYIVMELLEGEPLNLRLSRLGMLAPADALRITRQVAGSLGAAHAAGIIHRDLKPDNLFMIRDPEAPGGERPKILDFGIAKLGDGVSDRVRTQTGAVLGTPIYMSPEQCNGAMRLDHRADIYSLGCVLFHLLTGQPPFDLPGIGAIIAAHLREPPPRASSLAPHLPPELDDLLLRCLAKSPDDRFATMFELQQACDAALGWFAAAVAQTLAIPSGPRPFTAPRTPSPYDTPRTPPPPSYGAPRTLSAPAAPAWTTLSNSAGQSSVVMPRRRLGLWLVLAALAGGAGATLAVVTARPAAPAGQAGPTAPAAQVGSTPAEVPAAPPAPRAAVTPEVPPAVEPPGAAPVAITPAITSTITPTIIDAGAAAATFADAGSLAAVPAEARPPDVPARPAAVPAPAVLERPRPSPARREPAVEKPPAVGKPAKPKPKPKPEDLYEDRN